MTTFTVGPEEGKVYSSKKGYPAKADRSIDNITTQVHNIKQLCSTSCEKYLFHAMAMQSPTYIYAFLCCIGF